MGRSVMDTQTVLTEIGATLVSMDAKLDALRGDILQLRELIYEHINDRELHDAN